MLARLFVFFGGLLAVALCSLLIAPLFVDWAGYRAAFEREASRIIGQNVRVEGSAKASILPFPSVTFSNLVIDGADGAPAAKIAAFSMDAELAPFLNGEILIFDMRIERPQFSLTLAENGALLWSWPDNDVFNGNIVSLENVNVNDGRFIIERNGQEPLLFDGINGKISAQALTGPWLVEGQFQLGATTYQARLSTGAKIAGETTRARLALTPVDRFYEAAFDGQVGSKERALTYSGKLDVIALGNHLDAAGARQRIAEVKGDFSADLNGILVSKAVLTAGPTDSPYRAEGKASLTFGKAAQFEVSLKGQQFSFGELEGSAKSDRVTLGVPLADRLKSLEMALLQIPVPEMPGKVDLVLPTLIVGDTIIRNAEIKTKPAKAGWQIERYSVELPGRTIIEGAGDLTLASGLAFSGQVTLASKQPTGFANWLGFKANNAIRALQGVGLSARIDVNAERQTLRDIEFRAGTAVLRGLIDRQLPQAAKPQLSIQLSGENADLDVLSSLAELAIAQNKALDGQDIDFAIMSAPVSGFGFQADKLDIEAHFTGSDLTIDRAEVTGFSGTDFAINGLLSNSMTEPDGKLNLTVSAIDPLPLVETLAKQFPDQSWLNVIYERAAFAGTAFADVKFDAILDFNTRDALGAETVASATYQFDSAAIRFGGTAALDKLAGSTVNFAAKGEADHAETVLAALGVPVGDSLVALQPSEPTAFDVSLLAKNGIIQSGSLSAVSGQDGFETGLGPGVKPFTLVLADAAPYAMSAGYGLPGSAFGLPVTMNGGWESSGTLLQLQVNEGKLLDVPFNGDLTVLPGPRLKLTGNLEAQLLDRIALDDIVLGPLSASGDQTAKFAGDIGLPFDFDANLSIGQLTGFMPFAMNHAKARVVIADNALRIIDLNANVAGGKLAGAGEARKNGQEALLAFSGIVSGVDTAIVKPSILSGKSNLQFELSATGSNLETLKTSIAGSGVLSADDIVLNGLTAGGFREIIGEADRQELGPDAIATLDMADRFVLTGKMTLPPFQSAFTVTNGVARAPRNIFKVSGGDMAIEPSVDINSGLVSIETQLLFDAGNEAGTGSEPALNLSIEGPWDEPALTVDPQPLIGFLGQRALEREETRVEAIQSALLEKQRLRRENRYYAGLIESRAKAEAARLAEIQRIAEEAAKAESLRIENEALEKERVEKEKLEKQRLETELLKKAQSKKTDTQIETPDAGSIEKLPLNLDGLIEQLETVPAVQP